MDGWRQRTRRLTDAPHTPGVWAREPAASTCELCASAARTDVAHVIDETLAARDSGSERTSIVQVALCCRRAATDPDALGSPQLGARVCVLAPRVLRSLADSRLGSRRDANLPSAHQQAQGRRARGVVRARHAAAGRNHRAVGVGRASDLLVGRDAVSSAVARIAHGATSVAARRSIVFVSALC